MIVTGSGQSTFVNMNLRKYKHLEKNVSTAMVAINSSAGVTPEMNLRNLLHARHKECKQRIWNRGQIPEIWDRGKSGPTKRTDILQN